MHNLAHSKQTMKYEFELTDRQFFMNKPLTNNRHTHITRSGTQTQKIFPSKVRHVQLTDKYAIDTLALITFGLSVDETSRV